MDTRYFRHQKRCIFEQLTKGHLMAFQRRFHSLWGRSGALLLQVGEWGNFMGAETPG